MINFDKDNIKRQTKRFKNTSEEYVCYWQSIDFYIQIYDIYNTDINNKISIIIFF